jgi:hypothetical protein
MTEFRFANPEAILWILLLPVMVVLSYYSLQSTRKRLAKFIPVFRWKQLIRGNGPSGLSMPMLWQLVACLFFAIALARPQGNPQIEEHTSQSLDIMILLDVSRAESKNLA